MFDIEINTIDLEATALKGIKATEDFFKTLGMPIRLSEAGIIDNRFEEMANKATSNNTSTLGAFVKLTKDDIVAIYKLAQ